MSNIYDEPAFPVRAGDRIADGLTKLELVATMLHAKNDRPNLMASICEARRLLEEIDRDRKIRDNVEGTTNA